MSQKTTKKSAKPPSHRPVVQEPDTGYFVREALEQSIETSEQPMPTSPVNVTFALTKPGAKQVSVCGDFNQWSLTATPMKRHGDGHWEATVGLVPGRYQYKFLVDGEWIADPTAQESVRNEFGSVNSVLQVRA